VKAAVTKAAEAVVTASEQFHERLESAMRSEDVKGKPLYVYGEPEESPKCNKGSESATCNDFHFIARAPCQTLHEDLLPLARQF